MSTYFEEEARLMARRASIPEAERCETCDGKGAYADYRDAMDPGFWSPCGDCDETGRRPAADASGSRS